VLPQRVFRRFRVLAGLHPQIGEKGRVEFSIRGDDRPLASITLNGMDIARTLECDVTGISQLQLLLTSRGLDSKSNYAIWAEPELVK
ncbi:MAG: NPCBM/NEW2 domain-containing protein, partial [Prosthecobacter sp.]